MKYLKRILITFTLVFISLMSPFGKLIESCVNQHFASLDLRYEKGDLTALDKLECKILYQSMSMAGKFIYPEASSILGHYIEGSGKDLILKPNYIKKSPVIIEALKQMKVGEVKEIRYKQKQDWRLSYALNPFYLKKGKNTAIVFQKIIFKKEKGVYTNLRLGIINIQLPDRLIYSLQPKKFNVYSNWAI